MDEICPKLELLLMLQLALLEPAICRIATICSITSHWLHQSLSTNGKFKNHGYTPGTMYTTPSNISATGDNTLNAM